MKLTANPPPLLVQGASALHVAVGYGHTRVARTLLAADGPPTLRGPKGMLAIHLAAAVGQPAAARVLLDAAPATASAVDGAGHTPLWIAANEGTAAVVGLLLEAAPEAALAKSPLDGSLPLFAAARVGHQEVVSEEQRAPQLEHECVHEDITSTWNENRHSSSPPTLRGCMCGPAQHALCRCHREGL